MENPEQSSTTNVIGNEEDDQRQNISSLKEQIPITPVENTTTWVQRAWLKDNEIEEDIVCDVCMNDRKCEETGDDLVMCDKCNVAVHMQCYGHDLLQGFPTTDEWFCVRCVGMMAKGKGALTEEDDIACLLCQDLTGVIVETNMGWVHIACVNWFPEVWFPERDKKRIEGDIFNWRKGLVDMFTKKKGGACLQCDF